jgi:putative SOS response-associated peptidase YedK
MPVVIHKYDCESWPNPDTPYAELRQIMQPLPRKKPMQFERDKAGT